MNNTFKQLYEMQIDYQEKIVDLVCLPQDKLEWFSYHIQAMVEELGELMKADKRWKTHRNIRYEPKEKLVEIADIFITSMNIAIFSGITSEQLVEAIISKIQENTEKLQNKE